MAVAAVGKVSGFSLSSLSSGEELRKVLLSIALGAWLLNAKRPRDDEARLGGDSFSLPVRLVEVGGTNFLRPLKLLGRRGAGC